MILAGDCREVMARMPANSVDAVVCDPPYEIGFMAREWDRRGVAFDPRTWEAALRVLKPGGYLLAFGGTRTYHRVACAVEDAGFEIRDRILVAGVEEPHPTELAWVYGSGFPKSLDVSKAIDKAAGAERKVVGRARGAASQETASLGPFAAEYDATVPATEDAARWQGWGTALKPAHEPICVARKPLAERNVAANVLAHGTGALNIAAGRIGFASAADEGEAKEKNRHRDYESGPRTNAVFGADERDREDYDAPGRWPANFALVHAEDCARVGSKSVRGDGHFPGERKPSTFGRRGHDELEERHLDVETVEEWDCVAGCPVAELDRQSGSVGGSWGRASRGKRPENGWGMGTQNVDPSYHDSGGASRFFYCAKASRAERNAGLDGFEKQPLHWSSGDQNPGTFQAEGTDKSAQNPHPTVKPIALMRWLLRLVVQPGGTVLDPFAGSGSTGCAAALEGFEFVGIEEDPEYLPIAGARIAFWTEYGEDGLRIVAEREQATARREKIAESGQLDLLAETP